MSTFIKKNDDGKEKRRRGGGSGRGRDRGGEGVGDRMGFGSRRAANADTNSGHEHASNSNSNSSSNSNSNGNSGLDRNDDDDGNTAAPAYAMFKRSDDSVDKTFGAFEKHTRGIGSKLLMKMGWKVGEGLGPKRHGISQPIEVKTRKKNMGLQDAGERTTQSIRDFGGGEDSEDEEEEQFKKDLWRIRHGPDSSDEDAAADSSSMSDRRSKRKKKKVKYQFTTAQDLLAAEEERLGRGDAGDDGDDQDDAMSYGSTSNNAKSSKMSIVDMTGGTPQVRSASDITSSPGSLLYQRQQRQKQQQQPHTPMPELQHNLDVLVNFAESAVHASSEAVRRTTRRVKALEREYGEVCRWLEENEENASAIESMVAQTHALQDVAAMTEEEAAEGFVAVQRAHPRRFRAYGLDEIAYYTATAMLSDGLKQWTPFSQPPSTITRSLSRWDAVLSAYDASTSLNSPTVRTWMDALLWNTVLPHIRRAFLKKWDPREPEGALRVMDALWPFLNMDMVEVIAAQLVIPRLSTAIQKWNPRTDPVPVHTWVLPWVAYCSQHMQPLYSSIRYKLAQCMQRWHPSDSSAHAILEPWTSAWEQRDLHTFLARAVVPKLIQAMQESLDTSVGLHTSPRTTGDKSSSTTKKHNKPKKKKKKIKKRQRKEETSDGAKEEVHLDGAMSTDSDAGRGSDDEHRHDANFNGDGDLPMQWLARWSDLLSTTQLTRIVSLHVLPSMARSLCMALLTKPNFIQIASWYLHWKELLPRATLATEPVQRGLYRCLHTMDHALNDMRTVHVALRKIEDDIASKNFVHGSELRDLTTRESAGDRAGQRRDKAQSARAKHRGPFQPAMTGTTPSHAQSRSVKDLIEAAAEKSSHLFMPLTGKTTDHGLQLFTYGDNHTLYIEQNVAFIRRKGEAHYRPISVGELEEMS